MGRHYSPIDDLQELRAILAMDGLTTSERIVLVAIVLHRNGESGRCDPSMSRLASQTALSERHVLRAVQGLEVGGYLSCARRPGRSTCYAVAVPTPDTASPLTPSHPRQDVTTPLTLSQGTPDTMSPERAKERTKERTNEQL